jgi:hypothetical protein
MSEQLTSAGNSLLDLLVQTNFLFRDLNPTWLSNFLPPETLKQEKFFANRPIFTAFDPDRSLNVLYALVSGGPVILRSSPLDRIISITYPGSCFGMRNLPVGYGNLQSAFPSPVEAYKITTVITIDQDRIQAIYSESQEFRHRYDLLFELRTKFEYHLLNCSTYPPQAVAALLRGIIYQERMLGNQPTSNGIYEIYLSVDLISRSCQLNRRTVEQVLKGMNQIGLIKGYLHGSESHDLLQILDPEKLKEIYSATREKVDWWPLQ